MKLLLLHGAGVASSRKKLSDLKKDFDINDVVVLEEGTDIQSVLNTILSPSLLSSEQLFVLENPSEDFINYTLHPNPYTLILWFDHEIPDRKPILSFVKENKGEILFFPESKEVSVFPLLDSLAIGDRKAFLEIAKLKKGGFDLFYFTNMIFYLLRNLISTPKNAPPFVLDKLNRQRKRFNSQDFKNIYKNILNIEFKIKSGILDTNHAEFLVVNEFVT